MMFNLSVNNAAGFYGIMSSGVYARWLHIYKTVDETLQYSIFFLFFNPIFNIYFILPLLPIATG